MLYALCSMLYLLSARLCTAVLCAALLCSAALCYATSICCYMLRALCSMLYALCSTPLTRRLVGGFVDFNLILDLFGHQS
eukprot:2562195-Karenia_brevis.AAC.1